MTTASAQHGIVTEAGTIRFQRLLPGPIERVWDYLTVPEKRRTWFADGEMDLRPGGEMELIWRNSELTRGGEPTPERFAQYEGVSMKGRILRVEPPRLLVHSWDEDAEVVYELEERGHKVLLTLTNRRLPNRAAIVDVAGGWHSHLEVLRARLEGREGPLFWEMIERVEREYQELIPRE